MVQSIKTLLVSCLLCGAMLSCSRYPAEVQKALSQAGQNRDSLVAVLEHYRNEGNPLKYDAACFLIANMPYHRSTVNIELPVQYEEYFEYVDSILINRHDATHSDSIKQLLAVKFANLPKVHKTGGTIDIATIRPSYLISCIDQSFEQWHSSPLLKSMDFEEFKECMLPYRAADEPLPYAKTKLHDLMFDKLAANGMDDIRKPIGVYKQNALAQKKMNKRVKNESHTGLYDIYLPMFEKDCRNLAAITCNILRACGIPVALEFTPQWTNRNGSHYWCVSPDSTGKFCPYTPPFNNLMEDWDSNIKYAGKVFRMTYAANKNAPCFIKSANEPVPKIFENPCIIDVTDNYHLCCDIELPVSDAIRNRNLAYLAYFNTHGLNPIAWGTVRHEMKVAEFKKVPYGIVLFPVYMDADGRLENFAQPFIAKKGRDSGNAEIVPITCNHTRSISMHLLRKFPHKPHLVKYRSNLKGALILASNMEKGPFDTLYVINEAPAPYWQRYTFHNHKKYRYYKIASRERKPLEIAEYEWIMIDKTERGAPPATLPVFDSIPKDDSRQIYRKVTGIPMKTGPQRKNAIDGNLDTFVESAGVGTDFRVPVCVTGVQIYPRNARNGIEPGNEYQLLYYDNGSWVEHSKTVAAYNYIDVGSVPSGTMYWLRNLTTGKEELPFFYSDGKQIFISEPYYM